jgi:hypothetical protein
MKITPNTVVSLTYTLRIDHAEGDLVERVEAAEPFVFLFGTDSLLPDFEDNLLGKEAGNDFAFAITAFLFLISLLMLMILVAISGMYNVFDNVRMLPSGVSILTVPCFVDSIFLSSPTIMTSSFCITLLIFWSSLTM